MPRYRAPQENGGVLADPPTEEWPGLVEENRRLLDASKVKIDGVPLREFREHARLYAACAVGLEEVYRQPLVVTGHQPELSHPGVWVKNFAANGLARRLGGQSLNLIVDTDTLKTPALHVPVVSDDPGEVRLASVPFDAAGPETPYEGRPVRDPHLFMTFPDRVGELSRRFGYEPLLEQVWPEYPHDPPAHLDDLFIAARVAVEEGWGCENAELRVSDLADTPSFLRFAAHIAADADRFRTIYNAAVRAYRKAHRIRSKNHPVPDLADGELPFWGPMANGRRTRVTDIGPGVRPRALTLTLFARLCVGDFFLHGIGGGQYDEVADAIIRDYFGMEPPRYAVLSATLHLPLKPFPLTTDYLRDQERNARDLIWNPQIQLPRDSPERMKHQELQDLAPDSRAARRERYRRFRQLSTDLRPRVEQLLDTVKRRVERARICVAANAVLRRRDYSWVLYTEETLRPFLTQFLK